MCFFFKSRGGGGEAHRIEGGGDGGGGGANAPFPLPPNETLMYTHNRKTLLTVEYPWMYLLLITNLLGQMSGLRAVLTSCTHLFDKASPGEVGMPAGAPDTVCPSLTWQANLQAEHTVVNTYHYHVTSFEKRGSLEQKWFLSHMYVCYNTNFNSMKAPN